MLEKFTTRVCTTKSTVSSILLYNKVFYNIFQIVIIMKLETAAEKAYKLYKLGKKEESLKYWDIAISEDPGFTFVHVCKSETLRELGRNQDALACLDILDDLEPDEDTAWGFYKRAYLLHKLGKGTEAIANWNKVLDIEPNYIDALVSKGTVFSELYIMTKSTQAFNDALQCFDEALQIDPNSTYALSNKGHLLADNSKESEALQCYDKIIQLEPDNKHILSAKGQLLLDTGKYKTAIDCFDKVIQLHPENASAMYNKAKALYLQDKPEDSHLWLQKALQIEPELRDGQWLLDMLSDRIKFNRSIGKNHDLSI